MLYHFDYFIYYSNTYMSIFVLFRPKTKKTRFLTGSSKRTRKGQEKDNKGQVKDRKDRKDRKDKKRTK